MQDDRLSGLAVLSIENAEVRKLDVSKIIDDFASRKALRGEESFRFDVSKLTWI